MGATPSVIRVKRITVLLLMVAAFALLLVACGGGSKTTTTPSCVGSNFHMSCVKGQPAPKASARLGGGSSLFGVDTYGAAPASIHAAFDCTYLSGYPGGKDWTASGVHAWVAAGK